MKTTLALVLVLVLCAPRIRAQEQQQSEVIIKLEEEPPDYMAVRLGLWFPKDKEKSFTSKDLDLTEENTDAKIEQSQAFGLDFHYRSRLAHPLYLDFAVGFWYTTYDWNARLANSANLEVVNSYALIIPLTIGVSFNPLPENPIQPYAMAGIGAYGAFSSEDYTFVGGRHEDKNKFDVAFGGFVGAGLDFYILSGFGASVGLKYQIATFKEKLYTQQKDLTGLQVQAGIAMKL